MITWTVIIFGVHNVVGKSFAQWGKMSRRQKAGILQNTSPALLVKNQIVSPIPGRDINACLHQSNKQHLHYHMRLARGFQMES